MATLINDLSTSGTEVKPLIKSSEIFKDWNLLNKRTALTTNIKELKLVSKNLDEITKVEYTAWKKVSKAGSLSEDTINYSVDRRINL